MIHSALCQTLGMLWAGTVAARGVIADNAAGLAEPRLIERNRATSSEPREDLMGHQSLPLAGSIAPTDEGFRPSKGYASITPKISFDTSPKNKQCATKIYPKPYCPTSLMSKGSRAGTAERQTHYRCRWCLAPPKGP
jgi:hypothetical protein